ncbi:phenylalanine--tRNA ligase subunit alpha [Flectobacillus sp. BAB-3569]|jgi:phenylalanyl-tRNA synthetase alpha chain|uniref:phenylalanine--tRNA ligase subunit alpha n=1 Tax=Flectobacillus sp. BAB-3569 TaxID=1509483 RepID=UPI000BA31A75|nr:phenylalanine--tRNA ligase subunit alpha [Flectobacillus sp. BAB-3569]NBA74601.1 phenylalanine--tRNA ligase subunit alpha [Emticicia sp. ODNR4P]PAC30999.1 phenylalanine--tRNA ligase subunit alpha [Flectobacillus sp. BAB-3569]
MQEKIQEIHQQVDAFVIENKDQLEAFRIAYVGRKSVIGELFDGLKNVAAEQRREIGQQLNGLKDFAQNKFNEMQALLEASSENAVSIEFDLTLPVVPQENGTLHPLSVVRARIIEIFEKMGFNVSDGPEIETDFYNFTALNFAENHPAREMQDTFFIEKKGGNVADDVLLRTHTSNVQIRLMQQKQPPLRSIMPGRVYRNEAISARAHCLFHQVEGLYIDKNVGFKDLKDTLYHFAKEMFGKDTKVRYRPSYFPFTEPSAEIDISCLICKGVGCNVCKYTGWVEIAGSGMVDPNVLENCGIDSKEYTGFAFGMGIERITMLKYGIKDLRLFTENDVRFLRQFEGV